MDSQPASSSSAHFSSSKLIRLGAGVGVGFALEALLVSDFFDEVDRPVVVVEDLVLGSSFNQDSKLRSRSRCETSLFDLDCC